MRDGPQIKHMFSPAGDQMRRVDTISHTGPNKIKATLFPATKVIPAFLDAKAVVCQVERIPGPTNLVYVLNTPTEPNGRSNAQSMTPTSSSPPAKSTTEPTHACRVDTPSRTCAMLRTWSTMRMRTSRSIPDGKATVSHITCGMDVAGPCTGFKGGRLAPFQSLMQWITGFSDSEHAKDPSPPMIEAL